jgi:hypothetical protein
MEGKKRDRGMDFYKSYKEIMNKDPKKPSDTAAFTINIKN